MGIAYPGGAEMDRLASLGDPDSIQFPSAAVAGDNLDFSFSGLKTHVINYLHNLEQKGEVIPKEDIAALFTHTVIRSVQKKLDIALSRKQYSSIVLAGGVSANSHLRGAMEEYSKKHGLRFCVPTRDLCGDNAAMIAAQAYYEYQDGNIADSSLNASPCD